MDKKFPVRHFQKFHYTSQGIHCLNQNLSTNGKCSFANFRCGEITGLAPDMYYTNLSASWDL